MYQFKKIDFVNFNSVISAFKRYSPLDLFDGKKLSQSIEGTHQLILIGCHGDKDVLWENERTIQFVFEVIYLRVRAILAHYKMNAGLVAMH